MHERESEAEENNYVSRLYILRLRRALLCTM